MLDDLKYIHERDTSDALGVAGKQWQQLQQKYDAIVQPVKPIKNIVVAGMGGSAWPMYYLKTWPTVSAPMEIVGDYSIPNYVNGETLFIASSYSGNTEEVLSCLEKATATEATIVVVTAGGKLMEIAKQRGLPLFAIPAGVQPRMSTFYFLAAMIQMLESLNLCPQQSVAQLQGCGEWLKKQTDGWSPTVQTASNEAKKLAQEMIGKSPVIYAGPLLAPVARKWKICINENAKQVAWWNQLPESSHNEFIGWSGQPVDKPYCIVDLRSNLEHARVQKRFEVTERMLSGKRPAPEVVNAQGENILQQMLWASMLGDFTSIYLALLNNTDPTPVDLVEKFKSALG